MKIYLSPSGQVHNKYAYGDYTEAAVCRTIAKSAEGYLKSLGHTVKVADPYTNDDEWVARCTESDQMNADYHVPIHTNAGGGHGVRVFCYKSSLNDPAMERTMKAILNILPNEFKVGKVLTHDSLYEINVPKATTVYIECAFHDNKEEAQWIVEHTDELARAIVKGLTGQEVKQDQVKENYAASKKLYRVIAGTFSKKENAERQVTVLKSKGIDCYIKED